MGQQIQLGAGQFFTDSGFTVRNLCPFSILIEWSSYQPSPPAPAPPAPVPPPKAKCLCSVHQLAWGGCVCGGS